MGLGKCHSYNPPQRCLPSPTRISRCAVFTRAPFRAREHPLEAGRNCSSSHAGGVATKLSSIQRNGPFMSSPSWPKRVPIVLRGTIGGPRQQLGAQSQEGLLPVCRHLGLRESPHCLQPRRIRGSRNENSTLRALPK